MKKTDVNKVAADRRALHATAQASKIATGSIPQKAVNKETPSAETVPVREPARTSASPRKSRFSKRELVEFQEALVAERFRLTGVVEGLREESLVRHDEVNHEEDGTDAFIRLSGLDRASNEQSQIVKIDQALRAIRDGDYGMCELCGCRIETPRLQALPFVKTCIKCQSEAESSSRGRVTARQRLWD